MPIRQKLMAIIMLTSGAVLLLTCIAFFAYEFFTFRLSLIEQLSTLGKIVATNCTAALAFDSKEDASEILNALVAEKHIVGAALYDMEGKLFSFYPSGGDPSEFPLAPDFNDFIVRDAHLEGFQPVIQGTKRLGTLYLKSDLTAIDERFKLYGIIVILIILSSLFFAFQLSKVMQKRISLPILDLAKTAQTISNEHDFSLRVRKKSNDEIGMLTDAFNQMLVQIEHQNYSLLDFNKKLEQKVIELQKNKH